MEQQDANMLLGGTERKWMRKKHIYIPLFYAMSRFFLGLLPHCSLLTCRCCRSSSVPSHSAQTGWRRAARTRHLTSEAASLFKLESKRGGKFSQPGQRCLASRQRTLDSFFKNIFLPVYQGNADISLLSFCLSAVRSPLLAVQEKCQTCPRPWLLRDPLLGVFVW